MCEDFTPLPYPSSWCKAYGQGRMFYTTFRLTLLGFKARTLHIGFVVKEVAHLRTLCFCHDN